jgi:hypothetical protein
MNEDKRAQALFGGLISNEAGEPVEVKMIGGEAFYAIPDQGFIRHVEAVAVDDAVLAQIKEQIDGAQDLIVEGVLDYIGQDDLFTKASVDLALQNFEEGFRSADPEQWKPWLGALGLKVIVNVHGEVVQVEYPTQTLEDE